MDDARRPAWAGIDTHKDTNTLALLDESRRVVGTWEFPTGRRGYARLERAIGDSSVPVGIEGVGSYGAGVAAYLAACGYEVFEMTRPKREQRRRGKSDPIDAVAAAENLAAGKGLVPKANEGAVADVRALMAVREQISKHCTALSNCLDAMVVAAPDDVRADWGASGGEARMRALAASRPKGALRKSLKRIAGRWVAARGEMDEIESEMKELLVDAFPSLMGMRCVDTVTAARIVVAAGSNPERMGGEAAFSMLCGTSPIPASSGRTSGRHRLNRGGDRQANRAIHDIVRARMANDGRTQEYIARKKREGKTTREAVRCLCRFVAREVYRCLTGPQVPLPDAAGLSGRRRALGLRQVDVARDLGMSGNKVSRLELGKTVDGDALRGYAAYLSELEAARAAPPAEAS